MWPRGQFALTLVAVGKMSGMELRHICAGMTMLLTWGTGGECLMKKKAEVPQRKSEKKFYNFFFHASSRLTDFSPDIGARFLNELTGTVYANPFLIRRHLQNDRRIIQSIKRFDRILVIADLNIGDAINVQTAVSALRQFFPRAEIDYVISRKAFNLIDGNPEISKVLPFLTGTPFPNKVDYENVRKLVSGNTYDVIFNFCPFFKEKTLFPPHQSLINFSTMAELLVRNELSRTGINHIGYRIYQYVSDLVTPVVGQKVKRSFPGPLVTLPAYAVEQAGKLLFFFRNRFSGAPGFI